VRPGHARAQICAESPEIARPGQGSPQSN
jgi:hypothetical protein